MLSLLLFSLFFVLLPGSTCFLLFHARRKISCMTGMMSAMTIGMISGLGLGATIGILSSLNPFYSTMFGMLAGALLGTIAGLPISLMAVLDGMLSGLMAGMMGAMLADMVSSSYHMNLLRIFAIIAGGVLFLLHVMLLGEFKQEYRLQLPIFFRRPTWLFILVLLGGIGLNHTNAFPASLNVIANEGHEQHMGLMTEKSNTQQPTTISQIRIQAEEFSYHPNQIEIRANESVQFILTNTGKIEHDFEIPDTNIHIHAQPGMQETGTFKLTKPGIYQAVCTIPGHQEAGMTIRIQVV